MTVFMVALGCYVGMALVFFIYLLFSWLFGATDNRPIDNYDENRGVELMSNPKSFDELYEATRRR